MHWSEVGASDRMRFAVIGEPPDLELQSAAFIAAFKALDVDAEFVTVDCERDKFPECLEHLREMGFMGIGVGNPHKPVAAKLATQFYIVKHAMGVANALTLGENVFAQNTEVPGFRSLISDIPPSTALVLGSGRAARSAIMGLFESGWQVKLWNRNLQRSKPLVTMFLRYGNVEPAPQADPTGCSLIVNATPLGRKAGEEPPVVWRYARPKTTLVDFVYRSVATEFLRSGSRLGFRTIDGRELLVEQTAYTVEWWLQQPCPREPMLAAVGFKKPLATPSV